MAESCMRREMAHDARHQPTLLTTLKLRWSKKATVGKARHKKTNKLNSPPFGGCGG